MDYKNKVFPKVSNFPRCTDFYFLSVEKIDPHSMIKPDPGTELFNQLLAKDREESERRVFRLTQSLR